MAAVCAAVLTGCGESGKSGKTVSYKDGTYEGTSSVFTNDDGTEDGNGYGVVTLTITDGKIIEGGALNLHGKPNDSIDFYISFTDDYDGPDYGWTKWHVHGQRHTGFSPENE